MQRSIFENRGVGRDGATTAGWHWIKTNREPNNSPFEIGASQRSLPLEGLRGVAIALVFLHHYCTQFTVYTSISGFTEQFARAFQTFGAFGVELFFVLSGFLIYGILLRQRPSFVPFIVRRARRLYPAFLVALIIGIAWDGFRPVPKRVPHDLGDTILYLGQNILFIPGLIPIKPLFIVNWSLSYEWWFYATATFLFSTCRLAALPAGCRIGVIVTAGAVLLGLSASGLPYVPVRGLALFGGMLLAEASVRNWRPCPAVWGISTAITAFLVTITVPLPSWLCGLVVTLGFCSLCSGAFAGDPAVSVSLSCKYLRWFGNMSYSYYLVHGFVVVLCMRGIVNLIDNEISNIMFWVLLLPIFAASLCAGAILFLYVEKPYSFQVSSQKRSRIPREAVL
jgi:exopolysaccharide production protein ExoZ